MFSEYRFRKSSSEIRCKHLYSSCCILSIISLIVLLYFILKEVLSGRDIRIQFGGKPVPNSKETTILLTADNGQGCFSDEDSVDVLGKGLTQLSDVSVGDYIFDGDDYTKIYFMATYQTMVPMKQIKFGDPAKEHSITLTAHHLLYKEYNSLQVLVTSADIEIGDNLGGINNYSECDNVYTDYFNYTVYDISEVNRNPIVPVTNSGDLMVNGVKASAFTESPEKHNRLHRGGAIFRWISDNINETLTVYVIHFYYWGVYKWVLEGSLDVILDNQYFVTMVILLIAVIPIIVIRGVFGSFIPKAKTKPN
eukprot:450121_1